MVVYENLPKPSPDQMVELKLDDEAQISPSTKDLNTVPEPESRQPTTCAKVFAVGAILVILIAFGMFLAQCTRLYTELRLASSEQAYETKFGSKTLKQQIRVDADKDVARILVPKIGDFNHVEVVHDFHAKLTSIRDMDQNVCLLKPLSSNISAPKSMLEVLERMATGQYNPKPEVIRKKYTVSQKPMSAEERTGLNSDVIDTSCAGVEMYRLLDKVTAESCNEKIYVHDDTKNVHHDEVHSC